MGVLRCKKFEGICSTSWAITVASVANDELCAFNKTRNETRISYQNIIECCSDCYRGYENGCMGGDYVEAMKYLVEAGAVDGSLNTWKTSSACKNYRLRECYLNPEFYKNDATLMCAAADFDYTKAVKQCDKVCDGNPGDNYNSRVNKALRYKAVPKGVDSNYALTMVNELKSLKILVTDMIVYEDLYAYKPNDIYMHIFGRTVGTLTVAVVGFDTDLTSKQDFWIIRLPWGKKFGDSGHIKMQRGTNNCGLENPGSVYTITFDPTQ